MRWFFLVLVIAAVAVAYAIGPRGEKFSEPPFELFPDMDRQYKKKAQKPSEFFHDGRAARKPISGTVPIGYTFPHAGLSGEQLTSDLDFAAGDSYAATGRDGSVYGAGYPEGIVVDEELLERGHERYQIFCSPCHGDSGNGGGTVSKHWNLPPTANLIDARVSAMPEGQLFWTIANGKGLMGPYNGVIPVKDRWAIVSYLRVLQDAAK